MSAPKFSFDKSRKIKIHFRINRNAERLIVFKNEDGTDYDITGSEWEFFIKHKPESEEKVISLTIGEGLAFVDTNKLKVTLTAAITDIREKQYYWETYNITEEETWLDGAAIAHDGEFDDFTSENEFTIALDGGSIIVTVMQSGISTVDWDDVENKPATFAPSAHTHDDRYYTESEINDMLSNIPTHDYMFDDHLFGTFAGQNSGGFVTDPNLVRLGMKSQEITTQNTRKYMAYSNLGIVLGTHRVVLEWLGVKTENRTFAVTGAYGEIILGMTLASRLGVEGLGGAGLKCSVFRIRYAVNAMGGPTAYVTDTTSTSTEITTTEEVPAASFNNYKIDVAKDCSSIRYYVNDVLVHTADVVATIPGVDGGDVNMKMVPFIQIETANNSPTVITQAPYYQVDRFRIRYYNE